MLSVLRSILGAVVFLALSFQCGGCNNGESYFINMVWRDTEEERLEDSEESWNNCLFELMEELASPGLRWLLGPSEEAAGRRQTNVGMREEEEVPVEAMAEVEEMWDVFSS